MATTSPIICSTATVGIPYYDMSRLRQENAILLARVRVTRKNGASVCHGAEKAEPQRAGVCCRNDDQRHDHGHPERWQQIKTGLVPQSAIAEFLAALYESV